MYVGVRSGGHELYAWVCVELMCVGVGGSENVDAKV